MIRKSDLIHEEGGNFLKSNKNHVGTCGKNKIYLLSDFREYGLEQIEIVED